MSGTRSKWMRRRCAVCKVLFESSRHDAYLCSGKCRAQAFRMKHRKGYRTEEPQLGHDDQADDQADS